MPLFPPAATPAQLAMRWALGLLFAAAVVIAVAAFLIGKATAGEQDRGAWFESLKQPGTSVSCCSIADCKRTEARWEGEGWVAVVRGIERAIPGEKVLRSPHSIDGEAYVCAAEGGKAETATIYCFVEPDTGS